MRVLRAAAGRSVAGPDARIVPLPLADSALLDLVRPQVTSSTCRRGVEGSSTDARPGLVATNAVVVVVLREARGTAVESDRVVSSPLVLHAADDVAAAAHCCRGRRSPSTDPLNAAAQARSSSRAAQDRRTGSRPSPCPRLVERRRRRGSQSAPASVRRRPSSRSASPIDAPVTAAGAQRILLPFRSSRARRRFPLLACTVPLHTPARGSIAREASAGPAPRRLLNTTNVNVCRGTRNARGFGAAVWRLQRVLARGNIVDLSVAVGHRYRLHGIRHEVHRRRRRAVDQPHRRRHQSDYGILRINIGSGRTDQSGRSCCRSNELRPCRRMRLLPGRRLRQLRKKVRSSRPRTPSSRS